jgi:hypothetical protein
MKKNQVKLGMIVRVDYGPCGRVVEIDNEKDFYPYKVRYSGGLAEWASAYQMDEVLDAPEEVLDAPEEVLDAPEESVRASCNNTAKPRRPFKRGDRVQYVPRGWVSYDEEPTPYQEYAVYDDENSDGWVAIDGVTTSYFNTVMFFDLKLID